MRRESERGREGASGAISVIRKSGKARREREGRKKASLYRMIE